MIRCQTLMAAIAISAVSFLPIRAASAHCDGLDGPVFKAAQKALQTVDLNPFSFGSAVEMRMRSKGFEETLAVRKLGPESAGVRRSVLF